MVNISQQVLGYAQTNTYTIALDSEMIVIDPCLDAGNRAQRLFSKTGNHTVIAVLLTHAHFDHISGVDAIVDRYHCPVFMYPKEKKWLQDPNRNLSSMLPDNEKVVIKAPVNDIDLGKLTLGPFTFQVIATPGHTSGSVSFVYQRHAFVGDFIMSGTIGRTDLPTGSMDTMNQSIRTFVQEFKGQHLKLYPGHGEQTYLDHEIQFNPYVKPNLF